MKNFKIHITQLLLILVGTWAIATACSKEPTVDQPYVETDAKYYNANMRGLSYNGNTISINIKSNTYWVIHTSDSETDNWFSLSKKAGNGDQTITINVLRNEGLKRSATIKFETYAQVAAQVTIMQAGTEEVVYFYKENFSTGASNVAIADYTAWATEGMGIEHNRYDGVGTFVDSASQSSGYDGASGGNNILFGTAKSLLTMGNCTTKGDYNFILAFALKTPTTKSDAKFNIYISQDRQKWTAFPFSLEAETTAGNWSYVRVPFFIKEECPNLFFKFESIEAVGYRIDDISLQEGNGMGEIITFDEDLVTIITHNVLVERFEWADDQNAGNGEMPGSDGARIDNMPGYASCGWVADPIFIRAKMGGFLKCGYTNQGAGLYSPKLTSLGDKTVDLRVTMDISGYANEAKTNLDFDKIVFRVIGGGTVDGHNTERIFSIGSWNSMVQTELKIVAATSNTQFYIGSGVPDSEQVANSKSNRWFLDNVKVFYTSEKEDGFVDKITLSETSIEFATGGQSKSIGVESNIGWSVETDALWLQLSPEQSDAGASKLTISASKNDSKAERTAIVNFMVDQRIITSLSVKQLYSNVMPTMATPTDLKVIDASPYILSFNWKEPNDNTTRKYKVSIANSQTGAAITEKELTFNAKYTNCGFTFCALVPGTVYYMRVVSISETPATIQDSPQAVIQAATTAPIEAPSTSLAFQRFDHSRWGGDHILNTYGLRPKSMGSSTAPDAEADDLKTPNDGGSSDVFNTHDEAFRLERTLTGWYGLRAYEYPGYMTLGGASQTGFIATPVLSKIVGISDITVYFSLGNRNEPSADGMTITTDKAVIRIGVVDQSITNDILKTKANDKASTLLNVAGIRFVDQAIEMHTKPYTWEDHSVQVAGVKATDRIIIYSVTNGTASTGSGRFFVDNINVMPK